MNLDDVAADVAPEELAEHVVGVRHVAPCGTPGRWRDIRYEAIERAQERYDTGHAEMCQGRGRDRMGRLWQVQYAIPRRQRRDTNLDYFGTRMSMVRSA